MDDVPIEPYTQESRRPLERAASRLVELVQQYTRDVGAMHGGSSETRALFERNEAVARAVSEWNGRAADHTGTIPLLLEEVDENDFQHEQDGDEELTAVEGQVSVVSRWDLNLLDFRELIAAGRSAHRRMQPEETEEDAAVAVADTGAALYAVLHEAGEPLFEIPGVEVLSGARIFIVPDEPLQLIDDESGDITVTIETPQGRVAFSEAW